MNEPLYASEELLARSEVGDELSRRQRKVGIDARCHCGKPKRECWCFAEEGAENFCRCNIPNAGLPLTGDEKCQVCGKQV